MNIFNPSEVVGLAERARRTGAATYDQQKGYSEDRARVQAGRKMAAGDYGGASGALYGEGMIDAGSQVQNYGQGQEDRETQQRLAKGKVLLDVTERLAKVPQAQRMQALQGALPILQQSGVDTQPFTQLTPDQLTDQNLALFGTQIAKELEIVNRGNGAYDVVDKASGDVVRGVEPFPAKPEFIQRDPEKDLVQIGGAAPAGGVIAGGGGFDNVIGGVLQREGGYNASDGNSGNPVNFGINQGANPDIDVRNLTEDQAKQIYKQRYWDPIGGDQLPPEAQAAVFDAAVNQGVSAAQQMWRESGGDVQKFSQLRLQRYRQTPGYDKYGRAWEARVAETSGGGGVQGGAQVLARGQPKPQEQWEDLPGGGQRNTLTNETKNVPQPKGSGKLSAAALNLQNTALDMIQGATKINKMLASHEERIAKGTLNLNPVNNIFSTVANTVGASTEASKNFASFRADLKRLQNESLRLNRGVQTEGDAVRAWDELIANINDEGVVRQRLTEIKALNEQAARYHADVVTQLREDSGLPPIDTDRFRADGAAPQQPAQPKPNAPPRMGEVRQGYRYRGGDPGNKQSWIKVSP